MIKALQARLFQKHRTMSFPVADDNLPDRFKGKPIFDSNTCSACSTKGCISVCPTNALQLKDTKLSIDIGRCIFCTECVDVCEKKSIYFTKNYAVAASCKQDLIIVEKAAARLESLLPSHIKKIFGRSFKLRQVSAGGCNACEADINVLNTPGFDLNRFGIALVASPRHADGLIITGPVTHNMLTALLKTYSAIPDPKIVIACGACAISGGLFSDTAESHNGVLPILPVDLFIPGCPPHPLTILDGLLWLLNKSLYHPKSSHKPH